MLKKIALLHLILAAAALQTGCSGGGGQSGGACCSAAVYTKLSTGNWPSASVNGTVDPSSIQCTPGPDPYCITSFTGTTNAYGEYIWSTDALPGKWTVAADADQNCLSGGNNTSTITNNGSVYIYCGSTTAGTVVAAPAGCTVTFNMATGDWTSDCPSTVTLTMSGPILPTSYALTVSNYDDAANELSTGSYTASNPTTIVVPAPTAVGTTALTIIDPTTNQVLGAAGFTITKKIIKCSPKTC